MRIALTPHSRRRHCACAPRSGRRRRGVVLHACRHRRTRIVRARRDLADGGVASFCMRAAIGVPALCVRAAILPTAAWRRSACVPPSAYPHCACAPRSGRRRHGVVLHAGRHRRTRIVRARRDLADGGVASFCMRAAIGALASGLRVAWGCSESAVRHASGLGPVASFVPRGCVLYPGFGLKPSGSGPWRRGSRACFGFRSPAGFPAACPVSLPRGYRVEVFTSRSAGSVRGWLFRNIRRSCRRRSASRARDCQDLPAVLDLVVAGGSCVGRVLWFMRLVRIELYAFRPETAPVEDPCCRLRWGSALGGCRPPAGGGAVAEGVSASGVGSITR